MPRREIKSEGKDVATAIIHGLNELGRRRDQVEVTVIQEEKAGFLGIGGKPAIVHIIEKKWDSEHSTPIKTRAPRSMSSGRGGGRKRRDDRRGGRKVRVEREPKAPKENEPQKLPSQEIQNAVIPEEIKKPMATAKQCLETILGGIGVKAENLNVWWDDKQQRILLTFDCDHPAIIIGKEGKTLESIQYLITLTVSRDFNNPISVMADTQNYWRKLEDKVNYEIEKALGMIKRTKRTYRFRPMSAQMRRYIHRYLVNETEISTASEGEGKWRKVVLRIQTNKTAPAAQAEVSAETAISAETVSADNAGCECVVSAETASCECVADVNAPAPAEAAKPAEKPAEAVKPAEPAAEVKPAEEAAKPAAEQTENK